jgi:FkbM family methyltransferase
MIGYPQLVELVRRSLRRSLRVDLIRYDQRYHPVARRMQLIQTHGIDLILDIGANDGQYARELRELGYRGRIVSFEPLSSAFALLQKHAAKDRDWTARHLALGDKAGRATINVAGNSTSSSLLPMLSSHERSAPESKYTTTEEIEVDTLDSVAAGERADRLLIKIDAQGYERAILDGGPETVARATGVQLELSLVQLYQGGPLLREMLERMERSGFRLMSVEPVHCDRQTGQLLQMDGLFFRE